MKTKTKIIGVIIIAMIGSFLVAIPIIVKSKVNYSQQWEAKAKLRDSQYDIIKNAQAIISVSNRMIEALEHEMKSLEIKAELGRNLTIIEGEEEELDIFHGIDINIDDIRNEIREELGRDRPDIHSFDIDKLARAVAFAETSSCTKGTALTHNNCHGIRRNGQFVKYPNEKHKTSFDDFKELWQKYYGGFPTIDMANKYSGNDKPDLWIKAVSQFYYG